MKTLAVILMLAANPAHAQGLNFGGERWLGPDQLAQLTPPPSNPPAFQARLAEAVLRAANAERVQAGLPPLSADPALAQAAGVTVTQMRDGLTTEPLADRVSPDAAESFAKIGENLWMARGALDWKPEGLAGQAAEQWSERENLMDGGFEQAGVAAVTAGDQVFVAMVLAKRRNGTQGMAVAAAPMPAPAMPVPSVPLAAARVETMPAARNPVPASLSTTRRTAPDLINTILALPRDLLASLNTERAQQGLPALYVDEALSVAAQEHSEGMLETGTFGPNGATGVPILDNVMEGEQGSLARASVALWRGSLDQPLTARILDTWRRDAPSQQNMLDPGANRVGVGVAGQGDQAVVTVLYAETL